MFKAVSPNLQNSEKYTLNSANKMYVQDGYKINESFKNVAVDAFDSEVETIDFSRNTESAKKVNYWVEEKTQNKIKDLINPSVLNNDTRSVLVNAIFFHGKWVEIFSAKTTEKYNFFLNNQNNTKVTDMMVATKTYGYYESSELEASEDGL